MFALHITDISDSLQISTIILFQPYMHYHCSQVFYCIQPQAMQCYQIHASGNFFPHFLLYKLEKLPPYRRPFSRTSGPTVPEFFFENFFLEKNVFFQETEF